MSKKICEVSRACTDSAIDASHVSTASAAGLAGAGADAGAGGGRSCQDRPRASERQCRLGRYVSPMAYLEISVDLVAFSDFLMLP